MSYKVENLKVDDAVYELPTKTSDLKNDSQFQTKSDVEKLIADIKVEGGGDIPVVVLPPDTVEIEPNKLYLWDTVESLTITLATPSDTSIVNEYMIQFTSGDIATTLILPDTIQWMSEPIIIANATYQISIINNLAIIGEFIDE